MKPINDYIDVLLGDLDVAMTVLRTGEQAPAQPTVGGPVLAKIGPSDDEAAAQAEEGARLAMENVAEVAWLAGYTAAIEAAEKVAAGQWKPAEVPPGVKAGDYREFVVEVKSEYSDKTFVTSAVYLNDYEIDDWQEYGPEKRSGWHSQGPSPEYEEYLIPLRNVIRWRELPSPPAGKSRPDVPPAPTAAQAEAPLVGIPAGGEGQGVTA